MLIMSSNTATSVTRFLASTDTLKIPKLLTRTKSIRAAIVVDYQLIYSLVGVIDLLNI